MSCFLDVIVNSITGDCSNTSSGAFDISINGSAPDFTISWIDPSFGTIPLEWSNWIYNQWPFRGFICI
jgi:hypothetical protein